jgi:hypothetical protein
LTNDAFRALEECLPRLGQLDALPGAQKQAYAELLLQHADLSTERRLRNKQMCRRATESPLLRDLHKIFELSDLHALPPMALNSMRKTIS